MASAKSPGNPQAEDRDDEPDASPVAKDEERGMSRQRQRQMTPHIWKNITSISNTPQKLGWETNMS